MCTEEREFPSFCRCAVRMRADLGLGAVLLQRVDALKLLLVPGQRGDEQTVGNEAQQHGQIDHQVLGHVSYCHEHVLVVRVPG